jgi:4-hydroxybenzoate polyprenyltransferase
VIRRVRLLLLMARFRVAVTMWTFLLLGWAAHARAMPGGELLAAAVALAASYAVATSLNDVDDAEIDRLNRPRDASRPLVARTATVGDLRQTAGLAASVAVLGALPLGPIGVAAIGCFLVLAYAYSTAPIRLSHRSVLAPLTLTLAYVAVPYTLGVVAAEDRLHVRDVPLLGGLVLLFLARIVLKDLRDRLGDEAFGKPTLLFRLGTPGVCAISVAGVVLGTACLLVALDPPVVVAGVIVAEAAGVLWMLARLRDERDPHREQVAIGTAARAGNALLLTCLTWLVLEGDATAMASSTVIAALGCVFAASFLSLARRPETVRIGYKA